MNPTHDLASITNKTFFKNSPSSSSTSTSPFIKNAIFTTNLTSPTNHLSFFPNKTNNPDSSSPSIKAMSTEQLITVDPLDLKFIFELDKQISSSIQLRNNSGNHVGYKVKTTNPKKYCVRPNTGVVLPRSTCEIIVTMQAQKEAPPDMQCRDKFLLQSVVAKPGATPKDITPEMFTKDSGNTVEECKLKVVYLSPTPPTSAIGKGAEEVVSSNGLGGSRMYVDSNDKSSEVRSLISKLTEEKNAAIEQSNRIRQELDLLRRGSNKRQGGGVPLMFVILVGLIGLLLGYIMKK